MHVTILGTGCQRCQRLEKLTREVAAELHVDMRLELVRESAQAVTEPLFAAPALLVDGELKSTGRVPSKNEIGSWLLPRAA